MDFFLISSVTIKELEGIKTSGTKSEQARFSARKAVRFLDNNTEKYKVIMWDMNSKCDFEEYGLDDTNDNRIIRCAEYAKDALGYTGLIFYSNDLLCKMIARNYFKLDVSGLEENTEGIYKGYKTIHGNTELINEYMQNIDYSDWNVNEYLIIENTDDGSSKEMRFDGEGFVALKLPSSKYIKAKNSLQRCALDILNNPDITVVAILGTYGSGKSHLTTKMALYSVQEKGWQSKILCVRNPEGEGTSVGWLKGDFADKTDQFFLPIVQQLDGGEFECEALKQRGILEANIPFYMKGCTYPGTVMLVDEAEDLSEKEIRLVGTRIAEHSRIFMSGDYAQSIFNNGMNNALLKMCNELKGNPMFGCVCLDEDVRSETSKLFAGLFKN